jgi:hypothetical protein
MFLGDSISGLDANALAGNIVAEANATPSDELWADLDFDLNGDWDLFRSIVE